MTNRPHHNICRNPIPAFSWKRIVPAASPDGCGIDILPHLNYKNVSLIEIQQLEYPEFKATIDKLNLAWHKFSMGDYDDVLVKCRSILEDLSGLIKKQGFETERTNDKGEKIMSPDWKKFFGNEDRASIIGTIVQKLSGFVVRGAHTGSVIGRDEAYFAILQTFSLCNYIVSILKKQVES